MSFNYPDALTQATFDEAQDQEERMSLEGCPHGPWAKSDCLECEAGDVLERRLIEQTAERLAILEEKLHEKCRSQLAAVTADRAALACAVERLRGALKHAQDYLELQAVQTRPSNLRNVARAVINEALSTPPSADVEAVRRLVVAATTMDQVCRRWWKSENDDPVKIAYAGAELTKALGNPTLAWARPTPGRG